MKPGSNRGFDRRKKIALESLEFLFLLFQDKRKTNYGFFIINSLPIGETTDPQEFC